MDYKKFLIDTINSIEAVLKPIKEQLSKICREEHESIQARMYKVQATGENPFQPDELIFAAYNRCPCGAGMAYPKSIGVHGAWDCSAILMGNADQAVKHTDVLPFTFWEIKSEDQPSARGATTRPEPSP